MERLGTPSWHLIRLSEGDLTTEAADLLMALESAYEEAGDPAEAQVFLAPRAVDHYTFLMSPEISRMVPEVLIQFDATPCPPPLDLADFSPLTL